MYRDIIQLYFIVKVLFNKPKPLEKYILWHVVCRDFSFFNPKDMSSSKNGDVSKEGMLGQGMFHILCIYCELAARDFNHTFFQKLDDNVLESK